MARSFRQKVQRRRPSRNPRRRILLLCEGERTEPEYFKDLKRYHRTHLLEIVVDEYHGVPWSLVKKAVKKKKAAASEARRKKDAFLAYDEVWCVFDVDEHPNLHDARQQARDNEVFLAISNPCFELWALLHFQEQNAYLTRQEARAKLKGHLPGYEKKLPAEKLEQSRATAARRAKSLQAQHERADREIHENPSTNVFELTEKICSD